MAAIAEFPDINPTKALPQIVMSLDPFSSGLTLAALWAADVSTACTILMNASTLVSQDIYKRFINPNISREKYLRANRVIVLLIGIATLWMAFNMVGIVKMMMIGLSLTTAFTLVFLCTIYAPGLCRKNTAFWTTLVGIAGLVAWTFIPSIRIFPHVIYFEWVICLITLFVVRLVDKEPFKKPVVQAEE